MIRVLQVLANLNINSGMTGVVMNYHRHIDRSRLQFDYVYFVEQNRNYSQEIQALGGKIYKLPKPKLSLDFFREVSNFLGQHPEYHIIHCHPAWAPFFYGWAAKGTQIDHVIAHSHSTRNGESAIGCFRNSFLRAMALPVVTDYFACSRAAGRVFPLVQPDRIQILENAINTRRFAFCPEIRKQVRQELNLSKDTILIGHIGRFEKQKNHYFLIRIFAAFHQRHPKAKLLLVGCGSLKEKIVKQIYSMGLEDAVVMLSNRNDVERLYAAMDLFVLPSLYEGLGMVLLEAQASGLGCVAADVVPPEAAVTENYSICSLKDSVNDWADAMERMLNKTRNFPRQQDFVTLFYKMGLDLSAAAERLACRYEQMK